MKLQRLKTDLTSMKRVLIAYSGGTDSTFLLKIALDTLGRDNVLAVTAKSPTFPVRECTFARKTAKDLGVKHIIIESNELENPEFVANRPDRCYWCKKDLFSRLTELAGKHDLNYVLEGSNCDDLRDFRPGMKAVEELKVRTPLKKAGLAKNEIRRLSRKLGLPTWNKPSFACLASRIPYGTKITKKNLSMVDRAEKFLQKAGIHQARVRHHGSVARIEVSKEDIPKLMKDDFREQVVGKLKKIGFFYITVDLQGYRTGSMNEVSGLRKTD